MKKGIWIFVVAILVLFANFFINLWTSALGNNRSVSEEWNYWWSNEETMQQPSDEVSVSE